MPGLVLGVTLEPWATGVLIVAFSILVVAVAVIGGLALIAVSGHWVASELREATAAIRDLEEEIRMVRDTAVPSFATFLGTVGVATSGLVSPGVGVVTTLVLAGTTFLFASLAKDGDSGPIRRWLAVIAAITPVAGAIVAVFVSGRFASFSTTTQVAIAVGLVIAIAGLTGFVIDEVKRDIPVAPPGNV
jgi:hypothetical protein